MTVLQRQLIGVLQIIGSVSFNIYTIQSDETNLKRLTGHPGKDQYASWSPDGDEIVFSSDRSGKSEIYLMEKDGSNLRKLKINIHQ